MKNDKPLMMVSWHHSKQFTRMLLAEAEDLARRIDKDINHESDMERHT